MSEHPHTDTHNFPIPTAGTLVDEWGDVVNAELTQPLDIKLTASVSTFADLPAPDPDIETADGQRRTYLVVDERTIYRDTGSDWQAIAGLGSSTDPVPGTAYFETTDATTVDATNVTADSTDTAAVTINGNQLYIQSTEPANASAGDVWIDIG